MRAIVYERFGGPEVLTLQDANEPARAPGHARIRVHAAALNPKDVLLRKGKMRWLGTRLPMTPGYDVAGELLDDAEDLEAGTPVFGMIQRNQAGGCADVASLGANEVARKPSSLSMLEAASLPLAGLTALQALRDRLALRSGERILINGASGGVGTLAVQIAKAMGARVEAVCSARNAERVSDLGADEVIDYANTRIEELRDFDCVFDVFGSFAWSKARPALRTGGRYCTTIPRPSSLLHGALSRIGLHRAAFVIVKSRRCDLDRLRRWVEEGQLRPVIDRVFPLAECAAAHAYLETRRARGKVVLQLKG